MVPPRGLEPRTPTLSRSCSNQLSYGGNWQGMMGSNHRMSESKSDALPLGESPAEILHGIPGSNRTNNL